MEMTWRKGSWQIRLLEMNLPYSERPLWDQKWKLSLTSKNKTRRPLFPPVLYSSIHSHIPSSSNK